MPCLSLDAHTDLLKNPRCPSEANFLARILKPDLLPATVGKDNTDAEYCEIVLRDP